MALRASSRRSRFVFARGPAAVPGASHAQLVGQGAGSVWPDFKVRAQAAYQAPSRAIARELAAGVVADYGRKYDNAVACFMDDFEACIAHLLFPVTHRRAIRTTNLLERLFVEERRRLKIIPNAFGERAVLKLMFGALIRASERWRSIKVTEFERRQLAAVRKELDHEYEAQVGLKTRLSKDATPENIQQSSDLTILPPVQQSADWLQQNPFSCRGFGPVYECRLDSIRKIGRDAALVLQAIGHDQRETRYDRISEFSIVCLSNDDLATSLTAWTCSTAAINCLGVKSLAH